MQIGDVAELVHLSHLQQLRVLSLVDNPCVSANGDYRTRVRSRGLGSVRRRCHFRFYWPLTDSKGQASRP